MNKGIVSVILFWLIPFYLSAAIFGTIALRFVYYRGVSEPVGPITFSLGGDEFPDVSPENPAYIRIRFDHGAVLSEAMVDPLDDSGGKTPIFLRAVLHAQADATLNMPGDAVSIVRWRAGEDSLWIKITDASGSWVQRSDGFFPPDESNQVSFTIGYSAVFMARLAPVGPGLSNRETNARANGIPASTELRVDLSGSDLEDGGGGSVLNFDPEFFDETTIGIDAEVVVPGEELPILYTGSTGIGLARKRLGGISLIYPWISNNSQFESRLIANNSGPYPATVRLSARRADGAGQEVWREIPAWGSLIEPAEDLFDTLGQGAGYTVELQSTEDEFIQGRWITFNRAAGSGMSPSQGGAARFHFDTRQANELVGTAVQYGYLPPAGDFFSAPVLVNTGVEPVNIILYVFDESGHLLLKNDALIRNLKPMEPFAVLISELVPETMGPVNLVAVSEGGLLTGVSFVFNESGEPSIGNAVRLENYEYLSALE